MSETSVIATAPFRAADSKNLAEWIGPSLFRAVPLPPTEWDDRTAGGSHTEGWGKDHAEQSSHARAGRGSRVDAGTRRRLERCGQGQHVGHRRRVGRRTDRVVRVRRTNDLADQYRAGDDEPPGRRATGPGRVVQRDD